MKVKGITYEDFVNYKKPSMFIAFPTCTFKCEKECECRCCQNSDLALSPTYEIDTYKIAASYANNPITSAVVCGGLEPFDSFDDLLDLCGEIRAISDDDIVIYTGYYESEIKCKLWWLSQFSNIIIKFGRYIPDGNQVYDDLLGVTLASDNQYAKYLDDCKIEECEDFTWE